mmetsp:Transcript_34970/g.74363  ORF Transcript_34970/g.74363 Transcript_34970/m.74363 type:complete len:233 (-) Transcript_34970:729-1427(-)
MVAVGLVEAWLWLVAPAEFAEEDAGCADVDVDGVAIAVLVAAVVLVVVGAALAAVAVAVVVLAVGVGEVVKFVEVAAAVAAVAVTEAAAAAALVAVAVPARAAAAAAPAAVAVHQGPNFPDFLTQEFLETQAEEVGRLGGEERFAASASEGRRDRAVGALLGPPPKERVEGEPPAPQPPPSHAARHAASRVRRGRPPPGPFLYPHRQQRPHRKSEAAGAPPSAEFSLPSPAL